ncbi:S1 RNA-binding domain-containing protein [Chloroflexus sp. Y-396-1]|uniref:S1 RNA-binding domain-containing protein n=1 Tax=Chloroflexus sp. Y-396-1 TaxID=867845 RepID=UPI00048BF0AA|nr:S1 RNA-binding domain-containing protein [Chloroflexus sp. Y-396-1]
MTDQVRNEEVNADESSAAPRAVASAPEVDTAEVTTATPEQPTEQAAITEATTPSVTSESTATDSEATGASFTPVSDDQPQKPRRLKDLQPGMELEGKVTSIALYGVFVDIGVGRDGLVHISEMSDRRIETPSDVVQIGDTVKVWVKSIDPEARRISLTMRNPARAETPRRARQSQPQPQPPRRQEIDREKLAALRVGDVVEGVITGFAPFGAFADIGVGKDGLIHVSELAEGRVEKPEDAVKIGERYQFKILEIDGEAARISLSLRRALRTQRMQQLEPGQILEGTVSGIAPFGAFVDIGVGRDGLVHISALAPHRVAKVEDVVKVGDKVTVKVLGIDQQSKRISLTMRLEEEQPTTETSTSETTETSAETPTPRSSRSNIERFAAAVQAARERSERGERGERGERRERSERRERRERRAAQPQPTSDTYVVGEDDNDETFEGNATIEDLLMKFGGSSNRRDRDRDRDRRRRDYEDDEDEMERPTNRRQRDVIRRTLEQIGHEE